MQSEVIDLTAGTVRLDPGSTKNDEGRIVYLPPELITLLTAQEARLTALEKRLGQIIPFLFPRLTGRLVGTRKRDFRKAGRTACKRAGVTPYRHDFRPTAVRNMVNKGISEKVAMTITGHKTRSVQPTVPFPVPFGWDGRKPAR
jgi:integrase